MPRELPRARRIDGNRINRVGQVVPDRRRYFDWGDDYEDGCPLRPARRISPAKRAYREARRADRNPLAA